MNFELIAACLYLILCPCISYIVVRKRLTPWHGGVFFVMGDNSLIPVWWKNSSVDYNIPTNSVIKGVFLAGARVSMMPSVSFRRMLRPEKGKLSKEMISYEQYEGDGGVYQIYCDPMDGARFSSFFLDVYAPYPWSGYKIIESNGDYYAHVWVHFQDDDPKSHE